MTLENRTGFDARHEPRANPGVRDLRSPGIQADVEAKCDFMGDLGRDHHPQLHELSLDERGLDGELAPDREFHILHPDVLRCHRERRAVLQARCVREVGALARYRRHYLMAHSQLRCVRQPGHSGGRDNRIRSDVAKRSQGATGGMVHLDHRLCARRDPRRYAVDGSVGKSRVPGHPHLHASRGRHYRGARGASPQNTN